MTDWEKLKVTDLKEELKARGVPLTGLKLKQQLIDKLNELDTNTDGDDLGSRVRDEVNENSEPNSSGHGLPPQSAQREIPSPNHSLEGNQHDLGKQSRLTTADGQTQEHADITDHMEDKPPNAGITHDGDNKPTISSEVASQSDRMEKLPKDLPVELKQEENEARDASTPPPVEVETAAEESLIKEDDPFIPQDARNAKTDKMSVEAPDTSNSAVTELSNHGAQDDHQLNEPTNKREKIANTEEQTQSSRMPTPETLEDHRKRKRRSGTPDPNEEDISRKKAKANNGIPIPTDSELEILKDIQRATDEAQAIRDPEGHNLRSGSESLNHASGQRNESKHDISTEAIEVTKHLDTRQPQQQEESFPSSSRSSPDRDVSPALHPATASLYIRNFKRPLHIPTLRAHITGLAKIKNEDSITIFYLDSIRTHAFVSFSSVSAASRVRNAMHNTRFPDEPMREPLWIDFIPDEKVQNWIDQESGTAGTGFGGGRGGSKKYEVVYGDSENGVEASLREISNMHVLPQRPGVQQSHSNRVATQDPTATTAVASGIHPSRAPLVPQLATTSHARESRQQPPSRPSDPGKGFRALDELFSSTTAKPKLYYKLPPQSQIDDRLDMMRDLRVNHDQMGQSGDEGMKRYTFEKDERGGGDEWVDKGPEFGFGRRGQERLTGFGTNYGRGRGRGGFRGSRRGGDSWRGG